MSHTNTHFPVELPPKTLEKAHELNIFPHDIEEHFTRGGGHGGQKVNKTSSVVQLKHLPTGILVRSHKHREQHLNRFSAYKLLIQKIEDLKKGKESERAKKIFKLRKQKMRRSKKAKEKMLKEKKIRGDLKELRQKVQSNDV